MSRFMYFMDPTEPNLMFVQQVEKVREYFNVLSTTKLSKQTVQNYWKSLKRSVMCNNHNFAMYMLTNHFIMLCSDCNKLFFLSFQGS